MSAVQIVACADDFGISERTSDVILDLIERRLINATSCLVDSAAWPRTGPGLVALARRMPGVAIGLHLNLTEPLHPGAADSTRPVRHWLLRSVLDGDDEEAALAAIRRQWTLFCETAGQPPDFIDGHQHVHLFKPVRRALMRHIRETGFTGWTRQCRMTAPRFHAKRVLLDALSAAMTRAAREAGAAVNPGFGGLRSFRRSENLRKIWRQDLGAMRQGGVLMIHPGAEGSPQGADKIDASRVAEAALVASGALGDILSEMGLTLAAEARRPDWGAAH